MSEFSSTDAALEGLRVTREHPVAVLWWWGANVAAALVEFAIGTLPLFRHMAGLLPDLQSASQAVQQTPTDQAVMAHYFALIGQMLPPMLAFGAINLTIRIVLMTGVLRAVLRPSDSRIGYLRLSMEEVRQLGLALLIAVVFLGYAFAVTLASALMAAIVGGLMGGAGQPFLLGALMFVLVAVAFLYPAVRLSLAPAMTFADGRISLFRSWPLTRGRFWQLLGTYVVAGTFALMIVGFVLVASNIVRMRPSVVTPQSFADLLSPLAIGFFLFNGLFGALFGAVTTAPGASAFRQLTGRVGASPPSKSHSGSPWGQT